jgi:hypothetical protein
MVRTLARITAIGALMLPMAFVGAQPAGAAVLQSCAHVTGSATFTPGLTNTPSDNTVRAKGNQTGCTPTAATGGSGVLTATITIKAGSCAKLAAGNQSLPATATSQWKNGKLSHYKFTLHTGVNANAQTASFAGGVTSGLFVGKHVEGQLKFKVAGTPNCTTKPVKSITFTGSKPFTIST